MSAVLIADSYICSGERCLLSNDVLEERRSNGEVPLCETEILRRR